MGQLTEKRCSKCGEVKPLSEFYQRKGARDGHVGQCSNCYLARLRDWSNRNPGKVKGYVTKWQHKNPEKLKLYRDKHDNLHPEQRKETFKKSSKKRTDNLSDNYVANSMKIKLTNCPPALINLKRIQIQITRELRSKK